MFWRGTVARGGRLRVCLVAASTQSLIPFATIPASAFPSLIPSGSRLLESISARDSACPANLSSCSRLPGAVAMLSSAGDGHCSTGAMCCLPSASADAGLTRHSGQIVIARSDHQANAASPAALVMTDPAVAGDGDPTTLGALAPKPHEATVREVNVTADGGLVAACGRATFSKGRGSR